MLIVYDFEVFEKDWLVVFTELTTGLSYEFVNDEDALKKFYEKNKENLFIGFNNKRYDDYIFKGILLGAEPKKISDIIIEEENIMKLWRMYDMNKYPLYSMDIMQNGGWASLKELEGFIGLDIEESSVPFDIKRPLTEEEIEDVLHYCRHDVQATVEVVKKSIDEIKTKMTLVNEFGLTKADLRRSGAQLSERILGAFTVIEFDDELEPFIKPDEMQIERYKDVLDFYTNPVGGKLNYERHYKRTIAGVPHVLAYGGIHGAIDNFHYEGKLILLDVSSYYPSLMIHYDYMSRGVPRKFKERFKFIYDTRLRMKAEGKSGADHYKLILNTTYGCMKNVHNGLYDPRNANNVCIAGQLFLIDLIEMIEPYGKLVQSNTDGILVIPYDEEKLLEKMNEWSERTRMPIKPEYFTSIYQKDVNNYIMVADNGYVILKGGMVSQSNINGGDIGKGRQSRAIVDDAVVNYFVKKQSVEETIYGETDPLRFQIISKTGNSFYKTIWNYDGEVHEVQKVNRVFATKDKKAGRLLKVKSVPLKDGQGFEDRFTLPANTPDHAMLVNNGVDDFDMDMLDRKWYIELAKDRIRQYEG